VRPVNTFLIFLFLLSVTFGCFDQPGFSDVPKIEYEDIYFDVDSATIFLSISFQDGDGNFGTPQIQLENGNFGDDENDPYHSKSFFLENGAGDLFEMGTNTFYTDTTEPHNVVNNIIPLKIFTTRGQSGKLVTNRTRQKPNYEDKLPAFLVSDLNCRNYTKEKLHVFIADASIIDDSYNIADTIQDDFGNVFYQLNDTSYFEVNQNHYNIEVNWLVKKTTNPDTFEEYDWRENFCGTTYDGRIPPLSDTNSPIEATIKYGIYSTGFEAIFGSKILKLEITVTDRAFNRSNTIETPEFTMSSIKR